MVITPLFSRTTDDPTPSPLPLSLSRSLLLSLSPSLSLPLFLSPSLPLSLSPSHPASLFFLLPHTYLCHTTTIHRAAIHYFSIPIKILYLNCGLTLVCHETRYSRGLEKGSGATFLSRSSSQKPFGLSSKGPWKSQSISHCGPIGAAVFTVLRL